MSNWRSDLLEIPDLSFAMTPAGGVGEFSRGRIVLVNPTEAGALFTDLLDDGLLDGAELDFWALFLTGFEEEADRILLGGGEVFSYSYDVRGLVLEWLDRAAKRYRVIPAARFEFTDYPYAMLANVGRVKPVVLGDMKGKAFDFGPPATDGIWRHIPCPLIDGATPGYYLFDSVDGGTREHIVVLDDIPCTLVNYTYGKNAPIEGGDAASQMSWWSFAGISLSNTNNNRLYWKLTNITTTRTVSVYKNSDGAAGNLVAQGSRAGDGAFTLTEQNSSELSGSAIITYTADDVTLATNILTFAPDQIRLWAEDPDTYPPNLVSAWVRPQRVWAQMIVANAQYARTDDLDEYATIAAGGSLELTFPGIPDSLGTYAGASAGNAILYIVHSASGADTIDFDIEQSNVSIYAALGTVTDTAQTTTPLLFGATIDALNDIKNLTVLIDNCTPATAYIHRVILRVRVVANEVLAAWQEEPVYCSQQGFTESTGAAADDYQDGGYIDPPGTTERATALQNPADQLEALFRNRNWGLGLRAPTYTNPSATLSMWYSPSDIYPSMTNGKAVRFAVGDTVLINYELMRVTATCTTITAAGDALGQMSNWSFTGLSASNTNDGTLYWKLEQTESGVYMVSVFKDSAGTALVALGIRAGNGTVVLAAENASGVFGTVALVYAGDDVTVSANTLTFDGITVTRGIDGSVVTFHNSGDALYIIPTDGQVAIGSFRAARGALRHTTDAELLTNGSMEAFGYTSGPVEAGDTAGQLSGWSITPTLATTTNTNAGVLYWKVTDAAGTRTVGVYKMSTFAVASLVIQGSRVGDGVITLTEQNSSGLSGTVTVAYTADDADAANTLIFSQGLATGWTEDDPDTKITPASATGYARRHGQQITRSATGGGVATGVRQAITTVSGTWYRLSFWAKLAPAGNLSVQVHDGSNNGAKWTFAATTAFQHFECVFKAWDTTTHIRLLTGAAASDVAVYDEISCKALAEWAWDHAILDEADSRSWLDEACKEAGVRIIQDSTARTAARVLYAHRLPIDRQTWDSSVILRNQDGAPALRVTQTDRESIYTGVRVRYGYDHILKDFRGNVYVTTDQVSTGQAVTAWADPTITVASTTPIFPATYAYGSVLETTDFSLIGTAVSLPGATLQTNGVAAGDWFWICRYALEYSHLSVIASVNSETALTLVDPGPTIPANAGAVCAWTCFPYLLRIGGRICIPAPYVTGTQFSIAYQVWFDPLTFETDSADPAVGDVIWKLTSDSDDQSVPGGNRDQTLLLRENRERMSMKRVATYGQALPLSVDAPRIQDRETAVALRNHLFDYGQRHYIFEVSTDLSTIASEIGDQVTLTHDLVPGSSMPCEIISQSIRLTDGRIDYTLKEVKGIPR